MTTTLTLAAFLEARLAEDEAAAEDALERGFGDWTWLADHGIHFEARSHIARHDPVRVLAEVAAKRAIIQLDSDTEQPAVYEALRILAAVYSDHGDYRNEWRVS